jgi:uncharacterized protein YaeQ
MGISTTLYRFRIELSDIDRGIYEPLDFRVALHPSESMPYLLTRVIAFALNYQEGLKFSAAGLGDPDAPTISIDDPHGRVTLWIEIGNPSPKKLHRASKAATHVKVYTYKDPRLLLKELEEQEIHNLDKIECFAFAPKFLEKLATDLPRDVRWQLLHHDKTLTISAADKSEQTEVSRLEFKL